MENNLLHVKIITATGEVIEDDCLLLNAFLNDGEVGIMQGHLPLVGIIENNVITLFNKDTKKSYLIDDGVVSVGNKVTILADSVKLTKQKDAQASFFNDIS